MASFQVQDKSKKARFSQKTFLIADIRVDVVFEMFFLTLNNINIQFIVKNLI